MTQDQSISVAWYIGGIVLVASALIARRPGFKAIAGSVMAWVVIAGLVYAIVDHRDMLTGLAARIGISDQSVQGNTTRIRMASDGHFWAQVELNGVPRRMLIDSGATTTAISQATANAAGIKDDGGYPVIIETANGSVLAKRATIDDVKLGSLNVSDLNAVVSDRFGDVDVIGMNLLSRLGSWRVKGKTLILEPGTSANSDII